MQSHEFDLFDRSRSNHLDVEVNSIDLEIEINLIALDIEINSISIN